MKVVWVLLGLGALALVVKASLRDKTNGKKCSNSTKHKLLEDKPKVEKKWEPAEVAFKNNLNQFVTLLRGVTSNSITNKEDWTNIIVEINNDDLIDMWKEGINRPELWVTYLQTFNVQMDWVESFVSVHEYREMYDVYEGGELELGEKYYVKSPCWLYTDSDNRKTVLLKGKVSKNR